MKLKLYEDDIQKTAEFVSKRNHQAIIHHLMSVKSKYKDAPPEIRAAYNYNLAVAYYKTGDYTKADHCFDIAIGDYSGRYQIALKRVASYFQRGTLKEAKNILDEIANSQNIEKSGLYRPFCIAMGRYNVLTGNYREAVNFFEKANAADTRQSAPLIEEVLARNHLATNARGIKGSMQYASHLFKIDFEHPSNIKLSIIFLQNRLKEITHPEDQADCYERLSKFSKGFGDYERAKTYIEKAIALSPAHSELYAERIWILCQSKQPDQALQCYNRDKEVIKSSPLATVAVLQTFNNASCTTDFGKLTETFTTITSSLAKYLLKQKSAPEQFYSKAHSILQDIHNRNCQPT